MVSGTLFTAETRGTVPMAIGKRWAELTALAVLAVFVQQAAIAQETAADSETLEEIIVIAPQSLSSMRVAIVEAEDNVLDLFNAINDDRDYDIRCRRETALGTHIARRVCRPGYVSRLEARAEQDFLAGNGYFDPFAEIDYHDDILEEKMRTLFAENPELNQAATEYYLLKTRYDTERVERRED